ncbi:MAG TPA: RsmB/NOP family class I SAM-dependent RNA methyltransferase [Candidatus Korarchaeota archaeon]|nr:RsmB/NOP family class I SAM-dependent RNA methyltransferase [Candidatus Korarchaeota archaeon]
MIRGIPEGLIRPEFERRYREILGDEYEVLLSFMARKPIPSIRVNPMKVDPDWLVSKLERAGWRLEPIPWYEYGYRVLDGPERLGNTEWHQLGLYYVQEAASMIPPVVLSPKPEERVLDLAASPGSKTTQLSEMMRHEGVLVANDVTPDRVDALIANVQRMGSLNVVVTLSDGRRAPIKFGRGVFDKVLLDAPCSSLGEVRRSWGALARWSPRSVNKIARLQLALARAAYETLKPGGIMVYSTCTLEPKENEWVVYNLLKLGATVEEPRVEGLKWRSGLERWMSWEFGSEMRKTLRIYPQDNDTIGFYVAMIRKPT